jgi:ATP-dependent RNA helicase DeaD
MKEITFDALSISSEVKQAIAEIGFTKPTPIQANAIPVALEGKDVVGLAQTGTGKTVAFGIPLLEKIDTQVFSPQALVLAPTRELALQITEEFKKLAKYKKGLKILSVYGGASIELQLKELKKGVHIIIGTPGRVIDHIQRGSLKTNQIRTVVLDEADEMLNMGFVEDIELVLQQLPQDRQTLLFSATMSSRIMELTKKYQQSPQVVKIAKSELTVPQIKQLYYPIQPHLKIEAMIRLIQFYELKLILVFCNTKKQVDDLVLALQEQGMSSEGLHGDMKQSQRNAVMTKFRSGITNILIATDVAARGIDVSGVDAVFNFDLPHDFEYYVHRIGRTGRAGRSGMSFSFITGRREMGRLREIEDHTKAKVQRGTIPTFAELKDKRQAIFIEQIKTTLQSNVYDQFEPMIEQLENEGYDLKALVASLMKMHFGNVNTALEEDLDFTLSEFGEKAKQRKKQNSEGFIPDKASPRQSKTTARPISRSTNEKMIRLFLNLGRKQNISKGDILGAIAGETGLKGNRIGMIDVFEKFSFVEVPEVDVKKVLKVMDNNTIKGQKVNIEIAK